MSTLAIIGGSGVYGLPKLCPNPLESVNTPFGPVSGLMRSDDSQVYFLPRHGQSHHLPPHAINYQANIWALKSLGIQRVLALNAVGSLFDPPGTWFLPRQIIDYTYGRAHTFHEDFELGVVHVEFSEPLNINLIERVACVLKNTDLTLIDDGVYGCTQGPRLETAAEITRLERDGCSLVGMTLMPEAALAAELSLEYASLCLSVNWAAGKSQEAITLAAIKACLDSQHQRLGHHWADIIKALTAE
jgi:5'-deoxy-5'-methylthioadenosine phosphorylase